MKRVLSILGMCLFLAMPAWAGDVQDINTATADQLTAVKGVGEKTAAAIVAYRDAHGGIKSMDELIDVKGVGKKTLEKIKAMFAVTATEAPAPAAKAEEAPAK